MDSTLRQRRGERGQTLLLVAVSMLALIAFVAIAIDVTSLYINRSDAQHAAESAALAGAKAVADSGYTSLLVTSTAAQTFATNAAVAAGQQFTIGGTQVQASDLTITFPQFTTSNPVVAVVLTRNNLPVFFARIWGVQSTSVRATAQAEAYNPSGGPQPIQVAGVKPWLVANCDPTGNTAPANPNCVASGPGGGGPFAYFVDPADGHIENSGSFIGKTITLTINNGSQLTQCFPSPTCPSFSTPTMDFYPLDIPENPPTPFCAASSQLSCGNTHGIYYDSIACFNPTTFACGQSVNGPSDPVWIDPRVTTGSLKARTDQGTQCLVHETGFTAAPPANCSGGPYEQDCFNTAGGAGNPILIVPGTANPDPALSTASYISRSDSVVTVAVFNGSNLCPPGGCSQVQNATIVGFLQLGLQANVSNGNVQAVILNVSGCNPAAGGSVVAGGNLSSIPVRLIQAP